MLHHSPCVPLHTSVVVRAPTRGTVLTHLAGGRHHAVGLACELHRTHRAGIGRGGGGAGLANGVCRWRRPLTVGAAVCATRVAVAAVLRGACEGLGAGRNWWRLVALRPCGHDGHSCVRPCAGATAHSHLCGVPCGLAINTHSWVAAQPPAALDGIRGALLARGLGNLCCQQGQRRQIAPSPLRQAMRMPTANKRKKDGAASKSDTAHARHAE